MAENMMVREWEAFDSFLPGPREKFRAYMVAAMQAAGLDARVREEDALGKQTAAAAETIVESVPLSRRP